MNRHVRLSVGVCIALASFAAPAPSSAQANPAAPAAFVISLSDCDEIDRAALLSLLELELHDVAEGFRRSGPPLVELVCVGNELHIEVRDPVTGKHVGRMVPRPGGRHGERDVALAVSQLFLTSWLELLLPEPPPVAMPETHAGQFAAASERARAALERLEVREAPAPTLRWTADIAVVGGLGLRDLAAAVPTRALALSAEIVHERTWALSLALGFEHGLAERDRGTVELWFGDATLGMELGLLREGAFGLGLGGRGGVVWARLAGQPSRNDVRGDSTESFGARIALAPRAVLELDWFVLSLALEVGVDLGLPTGLVSGERAVDPGGFFGRALLGVGVRFGD